MNSRYNKELRQVSYRAYETRRNIIELSVLIEKSLQKELKRREKIARLEIDTREDEYERSFQEAIHKELIEQIGETFSRLQRYALFTTAMATIERSFVLLIQATKNTLHIDSEFSDRKPGVILSAINYLEMQAGIQTNRFRNSIKLMKDLVSIRNCIVHSEGCLTDRNDAEDIREFIVKIPTIEESTGEILKLLPEFVENMTHSIYTFFELLISSVEEKAQQINPVDPAQAPGR